MTRKNTSIPLNIKFHQTDFLIADFNTFENYLKNLFSPSKTPTLHLLPELFIGGYPLQDLCLERNFIKKYQAFLEQMDAYLKSLPKDLPVKALAGGLSYTFSDSIYPEKITNDAYLLSPSEGLTSVYSKRLLPNYDIFDERKYFTPGDKKTGIIEVFGSRIGILICEDMWPSKLYEADPVADLYCEHENSPLDFIVNLSASPYHLGKHQKRFKRMEEITKAFQCPFYYVNQVGLHDEILFDGQSIAMDSTEKVKQAKAFFPEQLSLEFTGQENNTSSQDLSSDSSNTWEGLFTPRLTKKNNSVALHSLTEQDGREIIEATCFGIQDYAKKNNFNRFTVALSGGIDSGLVLTLAALSLRPGQELEAIFMPGLFTDSLSYSLVDKLCRVLKVPLLTLPIKFAHSSARNLFEQESKDKLEGLADENIQSRLRGTFLYTRSNQKNSMVLNTSNKSEIAVGYSTLYGDSVGALSVIGDLYKSEVYQLSELINKLERREIIPQEMITRPPTAELRADQKDSDSLPRYPTLDALLEALLSYHYTPQELVELGFSKDTVDQVYQLINRSEFKRKQFCPIIKLKSKSFGFGHRLPICRKY